uniref:Uncharacterized protein n=1 Tax=Moniliophthora roreri TaxID=221103 RepID=A0A0W0F5Y2_MONRR
MSRYLALDKAAFIELWVETVLYGINTVLFVGCLYVFRRSTQRRTRAYKFIIATVTTIYILCSAHVILDFVRAIIGFFDTPDGALAYYSQLWIRSSVSKHALFTAACCVADFFLVYRLFVIWSSRVQILLVPVILLLTAFACGVGTVRGFSHTRPGETVFYPVISNWAIPAYVLHLAFNSAVNGLITGRLWLFEREVSEALGREHGQKYKKIIVIFIESGILHTITLAVFMVLYLLKSNAALIVYGAFAQIVGMAPTLIIVRISLGVSIQDKESYQSSFGISTGRVSKLKFHQKEDEKEDEISFKDTGQGDVVERTVLPPPAGAIHLWEP